jgi:hypothetical protein
MRLGSADLGVERFDFDDLDGRGVVKEDPFCECRAVALVGVFVGLS